MRRRLGGAAVAWAVGYYLLAGTAAVADNAVLKCARLDVSHALNGRKPTRTSSIILVSLTATDCSIRSAVLFARKPDGQVEQLKSGPLPKGSGRTWRLTSGQGERDIAVNGRV